MIVHLGEVLDEFTKDAGQLSPEQVTALIDAINALERKLAVASARLRSLGPTGMG